MADPKRTAFQLRDNDLTWFLSGHRYVRFKIAEPGNREVDPTNLPQNWATFRTVGWIEADAFLSECTENGPEKAFVFNGDQVMSIQVAEAEYWNDTLLWPMGSDTIANKWKALDIAGFAGGVDAAFLSRRHNATTGEAWFFCGYHCVLIKYRKDGDELKTFVREGPVIIATKFPALGEAGFDSVDCVLNTTTSNKWFFKGTKAVLINMANSTIVEGPFDVNNKFTCLHHEGFYP